MDIEDMIEKIEDIIEVLSNYCDIDNDGGPNVEMRAVGKAEEVIDALILLKARLT